IGVETAQPLEEHLVPEQASQHVQHGRALVVHESAIDSPFVANVPEAIAQIHGTLIGTIDRPLPQLTKDVGKGGGPARLLGVERGKVLSESLTQPLLVVIPPADSLTPPLMRELVGQEELR